MLRLSLLLLSFLFLFFSSPVSPSAGDSSWSFRYCRNDCTSRCQHTRIASPGEKSGFISSSFDSHNRAVVSVRRPIPRMLSSLGWDCSSECGYQCMRLIHEREQEEQQPPKKYHGKWPFLRVLGHQEFFSALFSWLNAVPHIVYGLQYWRTIPRFYPFFNYWILFAIFSINTWVWSAVFHTRDTPLTEKLDYYGAWWGILFAGQVFIVRVFGIYSKWKRGLLFAVFLAIFMTHVSYMQFVQFDYGWNMIVTGGSGIAFASFVIIWGFRSQLKHAKPLAIAYCCLVAASGLEIFDFPPIFELFDAHAIWHGLTPPIGVAMWKFALADANFQLLLGNKDKAR